MFTKCKGLIIIGDTIEKCKGVYRMKIKEKVFFKLQELCKENKEQDFKGITANEISEVLGVQRNVVSQYLNELCREGIVIKTSTRPVYFLDVKWNNEMNSKKVDEEKDPFSKVIGFNGSLKDQIDQCRAAAIYPNKGLPITLTGKSGVGKSYIAKIIYEYTIYKKCIKEDAPFITFNCADYANNPELLSANLFGYKKGAFTGADKDSIGLIESADNGYLFLDEVHRLSPEGQEKLFLFLDQGKFRRIGETSKWRKANVRFIFATTENLDEVLLDTFKRRIPIFIEIPDLAQRTLTERLSMIYNFYQKEAEAIDKDLLINRNVINILLSITGNGNVGFLKNVIISSIANAYRVKKNDVIEVGLESLPKNIKGLVKLEKVFYSKHMNVSKANIIDRNLNLLENESNNVINDEIRNVIKNIVDLENDEIDFDKFKRNSNKIINKLVKEMVFNNSSIEKDILTYDLIFNIVNNALIFIQKNYGIKYYGNTAKILTYIIINLRESEGKISKKEVNQYLDVLKSRMSKSFIISQKLLEIIEGTLDSKVGNISLIVITLYLNGFLEEKGKSSKGIIVAHGFSTASSIAAVANTCFEEYIFEPFDMPLDVTTANITKKIKGFLKNVNTEQGVLILVDMGSLNEIYNDIKELISGEVGIINNISTRMALDVASSIINKKSIEEIVKNCSENNKTEFKYYKAKKRKKAILVTCISGVGTAKKIEKVLKKCIGESDIEIIAQDYQSVVNGIDNNGDLKGYDMKLIISTTAMDIPGVNVVELQSLIEGKVDDILEEILIESKSKRSIKEIKDNMIKYFSLENIISQLTILNPNKIIDEVSEIINRYQIHLNKDFQSELKLVLFIHISALIERLVMRDEIIEHPKEEEFKKENMEFITASEKIFEDILNEYRVKLTVPEIINIYYIIKMRNKI